MNVAKTNFAGTELKMPLPRMTVASNGSKNNNRQQSTTTTMTTTTTTTTTTTMTTMKRVVEGRGWGRHQHKTWPVVLVSLASFVFVSNPRGTIVLVHSHPEDRQELLTVKKALAGLFSVHVQVGFTALAGQSLLCACSGRLHCLGLSVSSLCMFR